MNTYRIRGYTGRNADFDFTVDADVMPIGLALRDVILAALNGTHKTLWKANLYTQDIDFAYDLGDEEERSDLRDNDCQRVWVLESIYCNLDEDIFNTSHRCGEDGDGQGDNSDCEHDGFMITIDIERDA